jgi:hypothetical protein
MVGWPGFVAVVTNKFGADAYPRTLRRLMSLWQSDSLESYISEFEKVRYGVDVHNPRFDEILFVTQFVRGPNQCRLGRLHSYLGRLHSYCWEHFFSF